VAKAGKDWAEVVDRLVEGDQLAFLELSRLITGFLAQLRAFDFSDEWPDLIQEVLLALVQAVRRDGIRKRSAVAAYARTITRNKFANRLKAHLNLREDEAVQIDAEDVIAEIHEIDAASREDAVVDVRQALEKLPEKRRKAVFAVYGQGMTYPQAARETGIPLGSLKRYLREGLAELQEVFSPEPGST
jgi:RNA polymerase sigma-70 factor (ECF subfamily)